MSVTIISALSDVARLARRDFDARARGIGVTRPQWQMLLTLRRCEGINQGRLAELLEVEPITLCRMVDRLQEGDLVERRSDPTDRRAWQLFLTDKARALQGQLLPLGELTSSNALEGISEAEQAIMKNILERMRQNLSRKSAKGSVSNG